MVIIDIVGETINILSYLKKYIHCVCHISFHRGNYNLFPLAMSIFSKKEYIGHWAELTDENYIDHKSMRLGTKKWVQWGKNLHTNDKVCHDKLYCKCDSSLEKSMKI